MIFPFTIRYQVNFNTHVFDDHDIDIMNFIAEYIKNKNGVIENLNQSNLIFTSSLFSGNSWNIFAQIEKGEFNIKKVNDKYKLTYEFYMYRLFIIVSIMCLFIFFSSGELVFTLLGFAWLGGMNWLIAIIRHKLMFNDIIKHLNSEFNFT